jgi:hypothetical protein
MHGGKMIVDGECLYQRIVIPKLVLYGIDKLIKRPLARLPTFAPAMRRKSKRHIVVSTAQGSRLAVVVIASGHESPMDLRYESLIKGIVVRERGDPAIGLKQQNSPVFANVSKALRATHQLSERHPARAP